MTKSISFARGRACFFTTFILPILIAFSGCSDSSDKTTLTYLQILGGKDRDKIVREMTRKFEQENPDLKVELQSVPWDQAHEKLATMVATGNVPDVVEMADAWIGEFAAMGALEDLEPYLAKWPHKDEIKEVAWRAGRIYNNTFYAFPYGYYVKALFYRKDWFEQKSLAPPETMDEFLRVARAFTEPDKQRYGYSLRGGRGCFDMVTYFMFVFNGSDAYFDEHGKSTFDQPGAIRGLQFFADLYKKHKISPPDAISYGYNELVSAFYSGVTAMYINDPETIKTQLSHLGEGKFATALLPAGPNGRRFTKLGFGSYCILKASPRKDAAWRFIAFMNSPEMSTFWAKNNYLIPLTKSGENDPYFKQEIFKPFFEQIVDPETVFFPPYDMPEYSSFFESAHVDLQKLLLGETSPEETAKKWASTMTAAKARQLAKAE